MGGALNFAFLAHICFLCFSALSSGSAGPGACRSSQGTWALAGLEYAGSWESGGRGYEAAWETLRRPVAQWPDDITAPANPPALRCCVVSHFHKPYVNATVTRKQGQSLQLVVASSQRVCLVPRAADQRAERQSQCRRWHSQPGDCDRSDRSSMRCTARSHTSPALIFPLRAISTDLGLGTGLGPGLRRARSGDLETRPWSRSSHSLRERQCFGLTRQPQTGGDEMHTLSAPKLHWR